jgi:hypothetical protein
LFFCGRQLDRWAGISVKATFSSTSIRIDRNMAAMLIIIILLMAINQTKKTE